MRGFVLVAVLGCLIVVQGCSGKGPENVEKDFTYTVNDSANSMVGARLVVIHAEATFCGTGATYFAFERTKSAVIPDANGPVVLDFTLHFSAAFFESFYIDVDNDGRLSDDDIVIGSNDHDLISIKCWGGMNAVAANRTIDWTTDLTDVYDGPSVWAGGPQDF